MKKIAIAGASAVLAALPVVGVFAATSGQFTDEITVTVDGGCTLEVHGGTAGTYSNRTFSATITNGTAEELTGVEGGADAPAMDVTCNTATATAYHITAEAANSGTLVDENSHVIQSGIYTSGDISAFAFSVDGGTTWAGAPASATKVVSSSASSAATVTFNPKYRVYVSLGQEAGTYEGSVTYTIAMGA